MTEISNYKLTNMEESISYSIFFWITRYCFFSMGGWWMLFSFKLFHSSFVDNPGRNASLVMALRTMSHFKIETIGMHPKKDWHWCIGCLSIMLCTFIMLCTYVHPFHNLACYRRAEKLVNLCILYRLLLFVVLLLYYHMYCEVPLLM